MAARNDLSGMGTQHIMHQNNRVHPPFRLLYGEEAITPEELKLGSFCTQIAATTPIQRYVELEAVKSARVQATSNLDAYHQETKTWRDKKILRKNINPGDMVLIRHPEKQGKLQSQWYEPFVVTSMINPGVYRLLNEKGIKTTHTWNADNLRRFYP
jgi:hypothetical protein